MSLYFTPVLFVCKTKKKVRDCNKTSSIAFKFANNLLNYVGIVKLKCPILFSVFKSVMSIILYMLFILLHKFLENHSIKLPR